MTNSVTPFPRSETASARLIASAWSSHFAALWRGNPAASDFAEWLAGFWEPSLERLGGAPDARSALARAINRLRVVQRAEHQPA